MAKQIDLLGVICPYTVVQAISIIDDSEKGSSLTILIDDPLAVKAIPEELESDDLESLEIFKEKKFWRIEIVK